MGGSCPLSHILHTCALVVIWDTSKGIHITIPQTFNWRVSDGVGVDRVGANFFLQFFAVFPVAEG